MAKDTSNPFLDWYNSGALTVSEEQRVFFKKQAKELIEEAKQKLKENGKDYLALFQLAIGYYYNRRYKEAIPYFEKALEVNEEPRLLFYFANCLCLAETGLDKAALVLGEVADHYKKEPSFYNAKGILHSKRKEYITAIKYYEKAPWGCFTAYAAARDVRNCAAKNCERISTNDYQQSGMCS